MLQPKLCHSFLAQAFWLCGSTQSWSRRYTCSFPPRKASATQLTAKQDVLCCLLLLARHHEKIVGSGDTGRSLVRVSTSSTAVAPQGFALTWQYSRNVANSIPPLLTRICRETHDDLMAQVTL
jgi:hypothetical protein